MGRPRGLPVSTFPLQNFSSLDSDRWEARRETPVTGPVDRSNRNRWQGMAPPSARRREHSQRRDGERGAVLVESAFTLMALMLLVLGIMEVGRVLHIQQVLTDASREGARLAVTLLTQTSNLPSDSEIETEVRRFVDAALISGVSVQIERPVLVDTDGILTEMTRVSASLDYSVLTTPFFNGLELSLAGQTLMRNETSP